MHGVTKIIKKKGELKRPELGGKAPSIEKMRQQFIYFFGPAREEEKERYVQTHHM